MMDSLIFAHHCSIGLFIFFAIAILFSDNIIKISIYSASFSLIAALDYAVLGAPDVSITEISVNACISLAVLLSAGYIAGFNIKQSSFNFLRFFFASIISSGLFYCLLFFVPEFLEFGENSRIMSKDISYTYIEQSRVVFGFHNVVSAILGSFRGYDTLGETLVVFSSAVSVVAVLRVKGKLLNGKKDGKASC